MGLPLIAALQGSECHNFVTPESCFGYRPKVRRPGFLAGSAAFGTFGAGGLAPHIGQAAVSFLRS
jgi:hypothetical protein